MLPAALADLSLPPTSLAVLALLALAWPWGRRRLAAPLLLAVVLLSLPLVSSLLLLSVSPGPMPPGPEPGAIVVLGGDVERTADPDRAEIGALSLERVRAGAALHRRTGLPLLATGGVVGGGDPVGSLMARSLAEDFQVPVRWTESVSYDTWENAQFSARLLREAGISRVYVVTHDWHMRRSLLAFRRAGLDPVAAPVRVEPPPRLDWSGLKPRASAWQRSYFALHEWLGLAYYSVRR